MKGYDGFSNRNESLVAAKPIDPKVLKLSLFKKQGCIFNQECTIPLRETYSKRELVTPVRNEMCKDNPMCYWELQGLLEYLDVQTKTEKGANVYCCPNCIGLNQANTRKPEGLYYDRQLATLICLAKEWYVSEKVETQGGVKSFSKGAIVFKKGLDQFPAARYTITLKKKREDGKGFTQTVHNFDLVLAERSSNQEQLRFQMKDEVNINGMKFSHQMILLQQSKLLSQTKILFNCCGMDTSNMDQAIKNQLYSAVKANTKILEKGNLIKFLTDDFTFAFANKSYLQLANSSMSTLTVFYPRLRLWRTFYLQYENAKNPYIHPQGAVYLKQGTKIYVIGGYMVKFSMQKMQDSMQKYKKDNPRKRNKETTMSLEVVEIDLAQVYEQVLISNKTVKPDENIKSSGIRPKPKYYIDKVHKVPLVVKKLANIPDYTCNGAGVVYQDSLFVFGGCRIKTEKQMSSQEPISSCFSYNIGSNAWKKLANLCSPRTYHSALVHNNFIYIVGGQTSINNSMSNSGYALPRCNDQSVKSVEIYNPASNSFTQTEFKPSIFMPIEIYNDGFRSRALVLKFPSPEGDGFGFITGEKPQCYEFSPSTGMVSNGGSQVEFCTLLQRNHIISICDAQVVGPKLQQIFDYSPPKINGIYYYLYNSILQKKCFVVYGNKNQWVSSSEFDHGSLAKK